MGARLARHDTVEGPVTRPHVQGRPCVTWGICNNHTDGALRITLCQFFVMTNMMMIVTLLIKHDDSFYGKILGAATLYYEIYVKNKFRMRMMMRWG